MVRVRQINYRLLRISMKSKYPIITQRDRVITRNMLQVPTAAVNYAAHIVLTDRHLPTERYRSESVSAPYPEHTAGMAFQPC